MSDNRLSPFFPSTVKGCNRILLFIGLIMVFMLSSAADLTLAHHFGKTYTATIWAQEKEKTKHFLFWRYTEIEINFDYTDQDNKHRSGIARLLKQDFEALVQNDTIIVHQSLLSAYPYITSTHQRIQIYGLAIFITSCFTAMLGYRNKVRRMKKALT